MVVIYDIGKRKRYKSKVFLSRRGFFCEIRTQEFLLEKVKITLLTFSPYAA